jgi:hypothetical protein
MTSLVQDFREVLSCYNQAVNTTLLSGPTSFAPLIRRSIRHACDVTTFSNDVTVHACYITALACVITYRISYT